jgi:hypothetical protein
LGTLNTGRFPPIDWGKFCRDFSPSGHTNMANVKDSKSQILATFKQILSQSQQSESKVATKAETAQKVANREIVARSADYTVDKIVQGMADLQLEFGTIVRDLETKLTTEVEKLTEVKQAIEIERQNLSELEKVRVVADALDILTQEHQEKLQAIEQQLVDHREDLSQDRTATRKVWEQQQQEYTEQLAEIADRSTKQRQQETDEYQYKVTRDRQLQTDAYNETKRLQERDLNDGDRQRQKQWQEREKFLADNQKLLAENQKKVEAFPAEQTEATKKAREEGIRDTNADAKVKADLFEKEWEGNKQGYEFKIQSLEQTIERHTKQIEELTAQLQTALNQAQSLALKAFN